MLAISDATHAAIIGGVISGAVVLLGVFSPSGSLGHVIATTGYGGQLSKSV